MCICTLLSALSSINPYIHIITRTVHKNKIKQFPMDTLTLKHLRNTKKASYTHTHTSAGIHTLASKHNEVRASPKRLGHVAGARAPAVGDDLAPKTVRRVCALHHGGQLRVAHASLFARCTHGARADADLLCVCMYVS
jgi:hypothetical protein